MVLVQGLEDAVSRRVEEWAERQRRMEDMERKQARIDAIRHVARKALNEGVPMGREGVREALADTNYALKGWGVAASELPDEVVDHLTAQGRVRMVLMAGSEMGNRLYHHSFNEEDTDPEEMLALAGKAVEVFLARADAILQGEEFGERTEQEERLMGDGFPYLSRVLPELADRLVSQLMEAAAAN